MQFQRNEQIGNPRLACRFSGSRLRGVTTASLNSNKTPDGGVHAIFVITGRSDAAGCNISQPNFQPYGNQVTGQGGNPNIIFRIPTPVFGAGLIEAIPDSTILHELHSFEGRKTDDTA